MPENFSEGLSSYSRCPFSVDADVNSQTLPKSTLPMRIAANTTSFVIAFPTFYLNLLLIWVVLEKESLRNLSYNLLLAILSLADMLVGLVVQPLFIGLHICNGLKCDFACELLLAYVISALCCVGWSISTLTIICVERYLSIEHPLYYSTHVTCKKIVAATALVWLLVPLFLVTGRFLFDDFYNKRQIPLGLFFGLCIVIIIFCLTKVHLTARRQMRSIQAQEEAVQPTIQKRIKEYKRSFTIGVSILATVLFYSPSLIVILIAIIRGKEWDEDFNYIAQHIFVTFIHIQSLVNPIILSLRLSYLRAGVRKKLRWCKK